jgi:hypothetical protein
LIERTCWSGPQASAGVPSGGAHVGNQLSVTLSQCSSQSSRARLLGLGEVDPSRALRALMEGRGIV